MNPQFLIDHWLSSSPYLYRIPCLFNHPHHIHTTFIHTFIHLVLFIFLLVLMINIRDEVFTLPDHHPSLTSSSVHLMYPVKSLSSVSFYIQWISYQFVMLVQCKSSVKSLVIVSGYCCSLCQYISSLLSSH